jgi:hypothetical protein
VLDMDLPLLRLVDAEESWSPYRLRAIRQLLCSPGSAEAPEHIHWNWGIKALQFKRADHRIVGIEAENQLQGLMWVWIRRYQTRLPLTGEPLVYVDYLESAPWNARVFTPTPRFKGVGTRLLDAAIVQSRIEGFEGRVGLHALPQSEEFYTSGCGMQSLGADSAYQGLVYFEFTSAAATAYLERSRGQA